MGDSKAKKMIWIILGIALLVRLISLNQSLWLDESINVLATTNFSLLGIIRDYAIADFHPPLFFIILWIWTKIFGIAEVVVRMPSVFFGTFTVWMIYLIGKKIYSNSLGVLAAFLLAINPLHIYYSQDARMYSLATLSVAINMYFFIKLLKKEKVNLIFLASSNLTVLLSDYVAYFIFPSQFILLLFLKQKDVIKRYIISLIGPLLLWLIWLPVFIKQLDIGASASENLPAWKFIVGAFDTKTVPLTFVKFIIGRITYHDKFIYGLILLPISLIFCLLLYRGIKLVNKLNRGILIIWLISPVLIATVISLFIPIYNYFRVLYTIPAFILLIGLGILSFKSRLRYFFLMTVFFIGIVASSIYLLNPKYQREDWRGLVSYLRSKENSMTLFESSGNLPAFDYYAKGELNAKGALKNFPAKTEEDLADLQNIVKDFNNVYLVEYLVDISDPNRHVSKEIESLGYKLRDTIDFNGVGFVYNYRK